MFPEIINCIKMSSCFKHRSKISILNNSSIFTFLMGVSSVVLVRGILSVCCKKDEEDEFTQVQTTNNPDNIISNNFAKFYNLILIRWYNYNIIGRTSSTRGRGEKTSATRAKSRWRTWRWFYVRSQRLGRRAYFRSNWNRKNTG